MKTYLNLFTLLFTGGTLILSGCTKESATRPAVQTNIPATQRNNIPAENGLETQTIPSSQATPLGWIMTWRSSDGKFKTITKYDGLPTGYELLILSGQGAPSGWAVTNSTNAGYLTITRIDGMAPGSSIVISSGWGVPSGWIVTNSSGAGHLTITRYDGLPSGTQLTIPNGWGVPAGWIIYTQLISSKIIQKV